MLEDLAKRKFVSKDGRDLCIVCGITTQYKTETRVDQRENYVDGCGQLCVGCYDNIFLNKQKNDRQH